MAMNDDAMVKIMSTLGLNYDPAINQTLRLEKHIASLNQQLLQLKALAMQGAQGINTAFSSQVGQIAGVKTIYDQYGNTLKTINTQTIQATVETKKHGQAVQDVIKKHNILGSEFQRRAGWFITGSLFYGTLKGIRETVQTISEVEMGMVEIARIMEDETFVVKNFRDELLELGVAYGQTFDVVQDVAVRWAQAGYNAADTLELTKTALLALNTAELDATYATQGLIAIMAQWNLTAEELLPVIDKINKTADDYAVSSQDIVDGLNRSGAAAKNMNLTLEETIALITVMREASGRIGKEVGNALNTIISYMQRASSINIMERMGIKVFADEAKTQFVSILDLFEQISQKWNDPNVSDALKNQFEQAANEAGLFNEELAVAVGLQEEYNDLQKRDLAQSAAGVRRRNYFISLMERFSRVQEVVNNMLDAEGYSLRENERTMDSLEKKYNSLKATAQELAVALGDAGLLDTLKGLVEGAASAAHSFAEFDNETKALVLTVLELLAVLATLKTTMGLFTTKGMADVALMLPGWGKLLAIIMAVTGAVGLYAYNYSKAMNQSVEDTLKLITAQENELKQTDELIKKYKELESKTGQTAEVKDEMLDIQKQLAQIYPDYVDALGAEGEKLVTNIPLLERMNELKRQELELKRQELILEAETELPRLEAEKKRLEESIARKMRRLETGDTYEWVDTYGSFSPGRLRDISSELRKDIVHLLEQQQGIELQMSMLRGVLSATRIPDQYLDPLDPFGRRRGGGTTGGTGTGGGTGGGAGGAAGANEALRNALRLLEHKKRMDQLSLEEERNYLREIERLHARSAEERMDIAERIYNVEKAIREKALGDYKSILNEQQRVFKEIYQNQIDLIEAEAEARIAAQKEIIKGIEEELELLDRKEDKYNYEKKMAELEEELAYWSVRTSEQARQKVVEINKKIDELEHDREVELQKQKLQDKKRAAEEEIDAIEKAAEEERKKWKKSYNMVEKAFDDHSTNIIAMAATMSREAYNQWVRNYLVPLQAALRSGTPEDVESIVGGMEQSNRRSQIYQAAKTIVDLKRRWTAGDHSAAQDATYYYNKLGQLGAQDVANYLHQMTLEQALKYLDTLPKAHTGAQSLTFGAAYLKPGELIFPPDLSADLKTLIAVASGITGKVAGDTYKTDKRVIIQGPLFNSERTYFEDEVDGQILAKELQRAILALR